MNFCRFHKLQVMKRYLNVAVPEESLLKDISCMQDVFTDFDRIENLFLLQIRLS